MDVLLFVLLPSRFLSLSNKIVSFDCLFIMSSSTTGHRRRLLLAGVVFGWSCLIDLAFSTADPDTSLFSPDGDSSASLLLASADTNANTGGDLSTDLFSGSSLGTALGPADLDYSVFGGTDPNLANSYSDSQWLTTGSDAFLEASSCVGDDGNSMQNIGKKRMSRRGDKPMCFQDSQGGKKTDPDVDNLKLPNLLNLDPSSGTEGEVKIPTAFDEADHVCPKPYDKHLCCTGPGLQSFEESGIWDSVQGCAPCMLMILLPINVVYYT